MKSEDVDVSMSMMLMLYEMKFEFTDKQLDLINSQIKSVYWGNEWRVYQETFAERV